MPFRASGNSFALPASSSTPLPSATEILENALPSSNVYPRLSAALRSRRKRRRVEAESCHLAARSSTEQSRHQRGAEGENEIRALEMREMGRE